jgi:hypothetical protein
MKEVYVSLVDPKAGEKDYREEEESDKQKSTNTADYLFLQDPDVIDVTATLVGHGPGDWTTLYSQIVNHQQILLTRPSFVAVYSE